MNIFMSFLNITLVIIRHIRALKCQNMKKKLVLFKSTPFIIIISFLYLENSIHFLIVLSFISFHILFVVSFHVVNFIVVIQTSLFFSFDFIFPFLLIFIFILVFSFWQDDMMVKCCCHVLITMIKFCLVDIKTIFKK